MTKNETRYDVFQEDKPDYLDNIKEFRTEIKAIKYKDTLTGYVVINKHVRLDGYWERESRTVYHNEEKNLGAEQKIIKFMDNELDQMSAIFKLNDKDYTLLKGKDHYIYRLQTKQAFNSSVSVMDFKFNLKGEITQF